MRNLDIVVARGTLSADTGFRAVSSCGSEGSPDHISGNVSLHRLRLSAGGSFYKFFYCSELDGASSMWGPVVCPPKHIMFGKGVARSVDCCLGPGSLSQSSPYIGPKYPNSMLLGKR